MRNALCTYILLFVSTIIVLTSFASCSAGGSNEVLSFFFDGVEKDVTEDSVAIVEQRIANDDIKSGFFKIINYHAAYEDKQCDNCHEISGNNDLLESQPSLCYSCHDDFSNNYSYLHGPVASGYCTNCHDPHKSKNQKLLRRTGQNLCLSCHEQNDVLNNEIHLDIEDTDCVECHNPHGGNDKFLM